MRALGAFLWLYPLLTSDWEKLEHLRVARQKEGQGEMDSLLQEAGDVIPAARGPDKRVGLHGDVSSHELGRFLPTGAAAVADPIVIHAKPREHQQGEREGISLCSFDTSGPPTERIFQVLLSGTKHHGPFLVGAAPRDCRHSTHVWPISWAMVNAVARPMSSLMLQLRSRSHIPPTGARPRKARQSCHRVSTKHLQGTWVVSGD